MWKDWRKKDLIFLIVLFKWNKEESKWFVKIKNSSIFFFHLIIEKDSRHPSRRLYKKRKKKDKKRRTVLARKTPIDTQTRIKKRLISALLVCIQYWLWKFIRVRWFFISEINCPTTLDLPSLKRYNYQKT